LLGFGAAKDSYAVAAGQMGIASRVHLLEAVPPSDLLGWVASADVGAVLHPGKRLNDRNKTPNKLFECIAAGTPVVASDFPLMREFVLGEASGPLGVLCDPMDVEAIAAALRSLLDLDPEQLQSMRERCATAARERLNWEAEVGGLARLHGALAKAG
jgi:glycosyltransferase involved in cell wall biosynthesis